jgi:hypothetical protein
VAGTQVPKKKKQNKSNLLSTHALAHQENQIGGLGYLHGRNQKMTPAPKIAVLTRCPRMDAMDPLAATRPGEAGREKKGGEA